jgi:hypothetical protein
VEFFKLYGGEVTTKSIELLGIFLIVSKQSPQIILFKYSSIICFSIIYLVCKVSIFIWYQFQFSQDFSLLAANVPPAAFWAGCGALHCPPMPKVMRVAKVANHAFTPPESRQAVGGWQRKVPASGA